MRCPKTWTCPLPPRLCSSPAPYRGTLARMETTRKNGIGMYRVASQCDAYRREVLLVGLARRSRLLLRHLDCMAADLLLPPQCARCNVDLPVSRPILLCADCQSRLAGDAIFCHRCGITRMGDGGGKTVCAHCREAKFRFDSVIPLGPYREALRDAILWMKRPSGECLAAAISQLLVARRGTLLRQFNADCVVPVPMYWGRRFWRGVNSAQVVAEELSRQLGVPMLAGALGRRRNTLPQKGLGHVERFRNVRGAFALSGGYGLGDARVLVVDDIMTTGATCSEVAKTLKKGGVIAVSAVVVGRAAVGQ